jgi:sterol desaturase/sphingolipid hydroxylase (fatty acid hydroxylase superfamily)
MQGAQIIVLATPFFLLLIALELIWGHRRGRNTYRWNDALNSISLGIMSQVSGVFGRMLRIGIYAVVFGSVSLWTLDAQQPWVWMAALVAYDCCYYWNHRLGHTCALFWASHVVHHQSEDYNLSTALRQTSSGFLTGWVFYLPMAVLGFPPLVFGVVALVDLLYQYWVHTQHIGKLGWFDRWFCSPSNHRVHHAVNDRYLDKNFGGIWVVWDRLFGTFAEEDEGEPVVYGTRSPLRSWNPLWANLEVWWSLAQVSLHTRHPLDKVRVWFKPPGWRPPDLAARDPKPAFMLNRALYNPVVPGHRLGWAVVLFVALLAATAFFLWNAHLLEWAYKLAAAASIILGLWCVGWLCSPTPGERSGGARSG